MDAESEAKEEAVAEAEEVDNEELLADAVAEGGEEEAKVLGKRPADHEENEEGGGDKEEDDEVLRLAGVEFADREALWSWIQDLTSRLEPNGIASGVDGFVLFALLEAHPASLEKMAGGVVHIGYDINTNFPDTKSYYVERQDGSRAGFSVRKCVEEIFPSGDSPLFLANGRKLPHAKRFKAAERSASRKAFVTGSAISVSGLEGQGISHQNLRGVMSNFGIVRWVELGDDDGTAKVRFDSVASADNAIANCTDIDGCKAVLAKLSKSEEDQLRADWNAARTEKHHHNEVPGKYGPASLNNGRPGRGISRGRPLDNTRFSSPFGSASPRSGRGRGRSMQQSPRGSGGGRAGRSLR